MGQNVSMYRTAIHGLTIESTRHLPGCRASNSAVDVRWIDDLTESPPFVPNETTQVYRRPRKSSPTDSIVELHRDGRWNCLSYPKYVDFYFSDDGQVLSFPTCEAQPEVVTDLFLGPVLAILAESQRRYCLHAAAVLIEEHAFAFLGPSGMGKSTLLSEFLRGGDHLVTDDVLAVTCDPRLHYATVDWGPRRIKRPTNVSSPNGRLLKTTACMNDSSHTSYRKGAPRLAGIYLLDRRTSSSQRVQISSLEPGAASIELLRHGFCANLSVPLQKAAERLTFAAEIASRCHVKRLTYRTNLDELKSVRAQLLVDAQNLTSDEQSSNWERISNSQCIHQNL